MELILKKWPQKKLKIEGTWYVFCKVYKTVKNVFLEEKLMFMDEKIASQIKDIIHKLEFDILP